MKIVNKYKIENNIFKVLDNKSIKFMEYIANNCKLFINDKYLINWNENILLNKATIGQIIYTIYYILYQNNLIKITYKPLLNFFFEFDKLTSFDNKIDYNVIYQHIFLNYSINCTFNYKLHNEIFLKYANFKELLEALKFRIYYILSKPTKEYINKNYIRSFKNLQTKIVIFGKNINVLEKYIN